MIKFKDLRVLLVEDDPMMRTYLTNQLQNLGVFDIEECGDGLSGLKALAHFAPNLIITDIHMAPMSGLDFVAKLRSLSNPALQAIKIIMMSSDTSPDTLKAAKELGISGFLAKPPKKELLQAKIKAAFVPTV